MALHGKLVIDNAPTLNLVMPGIGVFPTFSGDGIYRNRGGCTAMLDKGPIPAGRYWIVDRPTGGLKSQLYAMSKDAFNALALRPSNHNDWFALYRDDGMVDDRTWINGVERSQFRLHPISGQGVSYGCVTLQSLADFQRLRFALLQTPTVQAGTSGLLAYGTIEVIAIGNTCP